MIGARRFANWPGSTRRYVRALWGGLLAVCCGSTAPKSTAAAAASTQLSVPYVCDETHDYRAFQRSSVLASVNAHVPRREQTSAQRETLTPGDPLWQLQPKPDVRCSADHFLVLNYVGQNAVGSTDAAHRMTVTIAPGTRLLDPAAHARMQGLAAALDEALTLLRTKTCSESGAPCDLRRTPDPLRFPGTTDQYSLGSEFVRLGRGAWFWRSVKEERRLLRAVFGTTDGRFDVELLLETSAGSDAGFGALGSIPELLSDEYDQRLSVDGGGEGGSHGK